MWASARSWSATTAHETARDSGGDAIPVLTRRRAGLGLLAFAGLSAVPFGIPATARAASGASEGDQALIEAAERYFNGIGTLQSRFIQTNPDGSYLDGTIAMKRPGHMHIDYGESSPIEVIANGTFFILVDHRLEEVTYLPLETTPAYLLLREDFELGGEIAVARVDHGAGLVRLELTHAGEEDIGSVTVTLNADPMTLRQWEIRDAQGQRTRVTLLDPRFGVTLEDSLFTFQNPYGPGQGGNR
nr:outer membrane lipoprotein carrier protein LolA [Marivibrio halodurans]